jgi:hypothetical protein
MSDSNYEFEDEVEDQATRKDPVRARMRELEQQVKAFEAKAKEAEAAQRELAFVKAGVNPDSAAAKYFVKGYDGELTPEAIRAAAEEANLVSSEKKEVAGEQQAWNRVAQASRAGETSEPPVDYVQRFNNTKSADEVMALIAQARAEAEKY